LNTDVKQYKLYFVIKTAKTDIEQYKKAQMQKQESPADARVTRDSAVIPRWRLFQDGRQPTSWILSNRK